MKTSDRVPKLGHVARLQRLARERADAQARRVPWQRLLQARDDYIDWQEFYLWLRAILEVENCILDWMVDILSGRCPGFVDNEKKLTPRAANNSPLPLRLEEWIDEHIFGFAKQEGWFNAITFYAIREPRYQKAEVCWSQCVKRWKKVKPLRYPSFEEWKDMAAGCDETAHLLPEVRGIMEPTKGVDPDRLAEAVSRYIDWEALGYWARPVLERESKLTEDVAHEPAQRSLDSWRFNREHEIGSVSCGGSRTTTSTMRKRENGSTPFACSRIAIRGQFAQWNTPSIAKKSGVQAYLIPTRRLSSGGEREIPTSNR